MKFNDDFFEGYENTTLVHYKEMSYDFPNTIAYEDLPNSYMKGVLKANRYIDGKLVQTYSVNDTHVLAIAATRVGKTTSCVIPTIDSFAKQKVKRSFVVSDPKGEIYALTATMLKEQGYDVLILNLRDPEHSELYNPMMHIFKLYHSALNIEDEVQVEETEDGFRNKFRGVIYQKQNELDEAIEGARELILGDVDSEIDKFLCVFLPLEADNRDPYWVMAPREYGKAIIYSMLEDSVEDDYNRVKITEDTFSLNTFFAIAESLTEPRRYDDGGYFSKRGADSKAYKYARSVIDNATNTRQCIVSCFTSRLQQYRNSTIRMLTSTSSFDMDRLVSGKPTAIFIVFNDESKVYYQIISLFIKNCYEYILKYAKTLPDGKLPVPFWFMLDEYGNFPQIIDMENVISACGGRNIWFYLVLQSYSQLENIYGRDRAEIIKDNLNMHIFLGSNNPETLEKFSKECGTRTRFSPRSALVGTKDELETLDIEQIPVVTRSKLSKMNMGECVITEANCGYVMFSKMERYYTCKEYEKLVFEKSHEKDYTCTVNPLSAKYMYRPPKKYY